MKQEYVERIYSGWLAKIIGIRYGAPIEGWSMEKIRSLFGDRMPDYPADYRNFAADDDSNGPWFFLRALEDSGVCVLDGLSHPGQVRDLEPEDVARALINYAPFEHGFFWWGGYGVSTEHTAYLNLRCGIPAPESGSIRQNGSTMAEQIGGQIFSDTWGLVNPGKPERAARMARAAASVTHDGDGLNGAAFVAASISAAFEERDVRKIIETGLSFVEPGSRYEEAVRAVMSFYDEHEEGGEAWRDCFEFVRTHYGYDQYPGICHIIPNISVMILALLYGEGDFDRTLEICNLCGWDTDCNVGNVACILGTALGLSAIGEKWRKPVGDLLICSSVLGYYNIQDIPQSASYIARLAYALDGEEPPEELRDILMDETLCHFEYPGSTHAMRLRAESGEGEALDGKMFRLENTEEAACTGSRSLKFSASVMEPGERLYVFKHTYYRPEEFTDSRYDPAFLPHSLSGTDHRGVPVPAGIQPAGSGSSLREGSPRRNRLSGRESFPEDGGVEKTDLFHPRRHGCSSGGGRSLLLYGRKSSGALFLCRNGGRFSDSGAARLPAGFKERAGGGVAGRPPGNQPVYQAEGKCLAGKWGPPSLLRRFRGDVHRRVQLGGL